MAKDYAKRVYSTRHIPPRKKRGIEWMLLSGVGLILIIVLTLFIRNSFQSENLSFKEKIKSYFLPKKIQPVAIKVKPTKSEAHTAEGPSVHFDFYNTLPNKKPNEIAEMKEMAVAPVAPQYVIALGEFQNETEASQMRLSLLLSGFETKIIKVKSTYQIQKGPFASEAEAKKIQKRLLNKGISGEVKKL